MTEFLAIPLKKPSEVDLTKPLKNIISSQYNTSDNTDDYNEAVTLFNKLRSHAIWIMYEKNETALEVMYK